MEALYRKFPWRSKSKWLNAATGYEFNQKEALKVYQNITHDIKLKREHMKINFYPRVFLANKIKYRSEYSLLKFQF
jgi:hypothetical protein